MSWLSCLVVVASVSGATDWKTLAERESLDGTVKVAYGLPDGHAIESVLMPYQDAWRKLCTTDLCRRHCRNATFQYTLLSWMQC